MNNKYFARPNSHSLRPFLLLAIRWLCWEDCQRALVDESGVFLCRHHSTMVLHTRISRGVYTVGDRSSETYCRSQWPRGVRCTPWLLGRWHRGFKSRLRHRGLSSSVYLHILVALPAMLYSLLTKTVSYNKYQNFRDVVSPHRHDDDDHHHQHLSQRSSVKVRTWYPLKTNGKYIYQSL
jgi:hypothetical protein